MGYRSTKGKAAPSLLCPPQIPHNLIEDEILADGD
jgi:hypothetical protein